MYISSEKLYTRCKYGNEKENLKKKMRKKKNESLRPARKTTIRTNYIKVKINNTQQNSKCRLCNEKDETISHIRELVQN